MTPPWPPQTLSTATLSTERRGRSEPARAAGDHALAVARPQCQRRTRRPMAIPPGEWGGPAAGKWSRRALPDRAPPAMWGISFFPAARRSPQDGRRACQARAPRPDRGGATGSRLGWRLGSAAVAPIILYLPGCASEGTSGSSRGISVGRAPSRTAAWAHRRRGKAVTVGEGRRRREMRRVDTARTITDVGRRDGGRQRVTAAPSIPLFFVPRGVVLCLVCSC